MSDNKRQKDKKNSSRVKSQDRLLYPSMQRNYTKKVENKNQITLFK